MQIDFFKWGLALETDEGELKAQTNFDEMGFNFYIPKLKGHSVLLTIGRPMSLSNIVRVFASKSRVTLCVLGFGLNLSW